MVERFEDFTSKITTAYKYITKIKSYEMQEYGLKASHLMCLYFIGRNATGVTAVELGELCREDKAGISKALAALKQKELIFADDENGAKKYRAKYRMTKKGEEIYENISNVIVHVVSECSAGLTERERLVFYDALGTIVSNLQKFYQELEEKNEHH